MTSPFSEPDAFTPCYPIGMPYHTYFPVGFRVSRAVLIVVMCLCVVLVYNTYRTENDIYSEEIETKSFEVHRAIVDRFYQSRKSWRTSKLGAVLYKNEQYPEISEDKRNKTITILIWRHWKILQNRHMYYFGSTWHDPLGDCSVTNCKFTGDDDQLGIADAVVVHLHRGLIPTVESRNIRQRWIFLNDESPLNVFALAKQTPTYSQLHNVFNWSMTYRSSADVPVPYGRTVALNMPKSSSTAELVPNWNLKRRDILAAILISNCNNYRMKLLKELDQYMPVDIHGKCGKQELKYSCPGHFKSDCEAMSQYLFYLVLENSKCNEYMTEKLFHNAYFRGAIPIIQGPTVEECEKFLPPNSYLHVDNYATLKDLAADVARISKDDDELLVYHEWRHHFEIANEHGYFGSKSFHLCRLCEAMNYNDNSESVYSEEDVRRLLDPTILCRD